MNEIIEIKNTADGSVVSARELHQFLESKQEFSHWVKNRIDKYGFEENKDFYKLYFDVEGNLLKISHDKFLRTDNQEVTTVHRIDYVLTLEMAKELSMIENNSKGKLARKYFIECEKRLREETTLKSIEPSEFEKEVLKARLMEAEAQLLKEKRETIQMVTNQVHKDILISKFYSDERISLPLPEVGEKSYSATELSKLILKKYGLNLSANKIGRIANEHNLKKPEFGVFLYDKSKYSDKTVESFHYYEKCVDEVVRLFRSENKKNSKKPKQEFNDSIHF